MFPHLLINPTLFLVFDPLFVATPVKFPCFPSSGDLTCSYNGFSQLQTAFHVFFSHISHCKTSILPWILPLDFQGKKTIRVDLTMDFPFKSSVLDMSGWQVMYLSCREFMSEHDARRCAEEETGEVWRGKIEALGVSLKGLEMFRMVLIWLDKML